MAQIPDRGHEALRRGRWSATGAGHFLTICTLNRERGLTEPVLRAPILDEANRLVANGTWSLRTLVVMPDHIHLVIVLGTEGDLTAAVRLFKGRLSPALRKASLHWQPAYFNHRLRAEEDYLPVFLYVFLNPYRAGLLEQKEKWPGYFCSEEDWAWFGALTNESVPLPGWLA